MIDQKLIDRINELTKISKERELTKEEAFEREKLRNEYRKQFRAGFTQTLSGVKVVDKNGNEIDLKNTKS